MVRSHSSFLIVSARGDFELFLPRGQGGGVAHYYRANNEESVPWRGPYLLLGSHDDVMGVSGLETGIGGSANFHVVYREGARAAHDWGLRHPGIWHGPTYLPGGG
ncbi:MAG: hypothetical protein FJW20_25435 [Acidimicrobiia bacterium]|nr:hypothetical protein [Acidimicrobiia bacterium]